jgi:hypothetical protein
MVIEMLMNSDIEKIMIQMMLHFQKEIHVIMYIIIFKKKLKSFHLYKILIRYEFSKFIVL